MKTLLYWRYVCCFSVSCNSKTDVKYRSTQRRYRFGTAERARPGPTAAATLVAGEMIGRHSERTEGTGEGEGAGGRGLGIGRRAGGVGWGGGGVGSQRVEAVREAAAGGDGRRK